MAISVCGTIKSQAHRTTMAVGRVAYKYKETRVAFNAGAATLSMAGRIFSNSIENGKMRRELSQNVPLEDASYWLKGEPKAATLNNVGVFLASASAVTYLPSHILKSMEIDYLDMVLKLSGYSFGFGVAMIILGQAIHYGIDRDGGY